MRGKATPGPAAPTPAPGRPARPRRRLVLALAAGAGVILLASAAYTPAARWLTRTCGEHLTVAETKSLVQPHLPADASDVRFYQHLHPDRLIFVDFTIDERGFLEWAARRDWRPEPIAGSAAVWPRLGFGDQDTVVRITNGYRYRNNAQRGAPNTVVVYYDRAARRAYYAFWSAPRDEED